MLNAGRLNKRFDIEKPVAGYPAVNSFGEKNIVWEKVATTWGSVEPISGREFWAQQQVQSEITVRFRVRYRTDILNGMRIVYSGAYYAIKSIIDPLEKHEELQLMCSEGVLVG